MIKMAEKIPEVSIITVTYSSEKHVLPLIHSVKQFCKDVLYEHIIIDNGSADETLKLLHLNKMVKVNSLGENKGFSAANLIGYQHARGQFLLFLNPDMEFLESNHNENMKSLLTYARLKKDAAIIGCKLVDNEGNLNNHATPRRFPKLLDQFAILLQLDKIFPKLLDRYLYKDLDFNEEQSVDSVRGSFMLMPRHFIEKVGMPFDTRYFIWFEDVDICREAKRLGLKVLYTPLVSCKDSIGQSFKLQNRKWRFRQYAKSYTIYLKKWEKGAYFAASFIFTPLAKFLSLDFIHKTSNFLKNLSFKKSEIS